MLPFRTFNPIPPLPLCIQPACFADVLNQAPVMRENVYDTIGIPYAFDYHLTQGFYLTVASFVLLRWLRDSGLQAYRRGRKK